MHRSALPVLCALLTALPAFAQYTPAAAQNAPKVHRLEKVRDERTGETITREVTTEAPKDSHGNAQGNQFDLAVDGAFDGQTVLIIDQVGNTLVNTRAALKQKGLNSVVYPPGSIPKVAELQAALKKSCQVWLISTSTPQLGDAHLAALKAFFDAGHGVYIWGDNDPLYADANRLANTLVPGLRMEGNVLGEVPVGLADPDGGKVGLRKNHLVTTGLEHLYEGTSIATIQFTPPHGRNPELYDGTDGPSRRPALPAGFTPILYGSGKNLVTVAYEQDGKRLLMDGGFTRLAVSWDDAGTARYVKNAAAWLVHAERFADTVAVKAATTQR